MVVGLKQALLLALWASGVIAGSGSVEQNGSALGASAPTIKSVTFAVENIPSFYAAEPPAVAVGNGDDNMDVNKLHLRSHKGSSSHGKGGHNHHSKKTKTKTKTKKKTTKTTKATTKETISTTTTTKAHKTTTTTTKQKPTTSTKANEASRTRTGKQAPRYPEQVAAQVNSVLGLSAEPAEYDYDSIKSKENSDEAMSSDITYGEGRFLFQYHGSCASPTWQVWYGGKASGPSWEALQGSAQKRSDSCSVLSSATPATATAKL
ncbi:uncharacterized protein BO88DRAFT_412046 [Aspergillus vadensis CBS 113365]|uniref:Uncharacterized protein n=1 Tax=Aspergillus vadensis (strain CBS 113365 / IMI 142717 / IBT 24658) TaxID=1448311 RepID=A0A319BKD8_ASPVC|nr:hypothetical protein BO88DRAFT_412046 [Aspergillus vadensis CBS 113365]PYH73167.1 hypothetical protein BO88DRAFT_412046 [Aspergillus vadensis CBS 113365]